MKDNRLKGIIALAAVTAISFGVIYGSKILVKDEAGNNTDNTNNQSQEELPGAIDVTGAEGIVSAREITDDSGNVTGYSVVSEAKGFARNVTMEILFDKDAKTIQEVKVVSHAETPGYGANIEEESFLNQFKGIAAPIYLKGTAPATDTTAAQETTTPATTDGLKDGIYRVETEEFDQRGEKHILTLKVENGAITSVVFDAMTKEGEFLSYLSTAGKYVMTEDGPTWKEQADALANYVLENQSIEGLTMDENGETDVVAGVSISINEFVELAEIALQKAASGESDESTGSADAGSGNGAVSGAVGEIDGISGATFTTNAVLELVNNAYEFIKDYAGK